MREVAAALMRPQECDDDLLPAAALFAAQPLADLTQREVIAEVFAQLDQAQPCGVLTFAAKRAEIIGLIDVCEAVGF